MYETAKWTLWERERVGRIGIMTKNKEVQCTLLDTWGWCTGMTQRDGMGREEGGGLRMGNTCIPVADSF